jgi:predicted RNA-binding protein associated with RNAse of E/G family
VEIVYRRLPDDVKRFRQELLHDGPQCKISLLLLPGSAEPLRVGELRLPPGGAILWYLFPGRSYEVAGVYDPRGRFLGWYTNLLRPPEIRDGAWELTDLYLDVWQPPDGPATLLDREDLAGALEAGVISAEEAGRVEAEADSVLRASRAGRWPPKIVRRLPLDAVGSLRLRRDAPGTWYANLLIGRLIGFGMYLFGAVSLISLLFAALTHAFTGGETALAAWYATIGTAAAVLLALSLGGKLPATRWPRPEESLNERILFFGSLTAGLAVFVYPDDRLWRSALIAIYAILAAFLAIFAVARLRWDRRLPRLALAGLVVCLFALGVLLLG